MPIDATLLARVVQGEISVFARLYDRHASSLLRFAQRVDREEAQDLLQTTFLRAVQRADRFDGREASARSWLFGIMLRVAQERRRSTGRFKAAMERLAAESVEAKAPPPQLTCDLHKALARLTPAKRTVVWLVEVEGFTCEETAALLQIPIGTVFTRLHHARRQLREVYRDETL